MPRPFAGWNRRSPDQRLAANIELDDEPVQLVERSGLESISHSGSASPPSIKSMALSGNLPVGDCSERQSRPPHDGGIGDFHQ